MSHSSYQTHEILTIHAIDHEGRGIARRADGKTVFVAGALPLEQVRAQVVESKSHFDVAQVREIIHPSSQRITPLCPHYQSCGGCSLQHAAFEAQVAYKQRVFEEQLRRIGKIWPDEILPPLYGQAWHYRNRTRLTVQTQKDGRLKMGFLAKRSRQVVDIEDCPVLVKPLSGSLKTLRQMLEALHQATPNARISAIELYNNGNVAAVNIVAQQKLPEKVLANWLPQLNTLSGSLNGATTNWQIWQQIDRTPPKQLMPHNAPELAYRLPEWDLCLPYRPADFTQVNLALNEIMVSRAVRYLAPQSHEKVADLFCGLGNFSLPLAKTGAQVLGLEGLVSLTERATNNARINGLHNIQFTTTDLFTTTAQTIKRWGRIDKLLLDPPRAGALAVVQALHTPFLPQRIVYVSCNPATFARDAAALQQKGYHFQAAGVMNLFAQTAHVEAIGIFELG